MLAYSFQEKKIHTSTRSYLRAFYRQAAPNFAYSFIKFEEKFQPILVYRIDMHARLIILRKKSPLHTLQIFTS